MPRITIEFERCKGCGLCVETCPEKCIAMEGAVNSIGWQTVVFVKPDACNGCLMCAEICPDVAIEVYK